MEMQHRLALGTVQFGLNYGIANQKGQTQRDEASAIVDFAWSRGVDTIDTAIVYGDSEQRLGEIGVKQWKIISKLPPVPENCSDVTTWVQKSIADSLQRLKVEKLYGLLLHCPKQLLRSGYEGLYPALLTLKEQGKVDKIGISVYGPEELEVLWPRFQFDLVQAPFNIIDRRLVSSGWLKKLHQAKVEVHTRSTFLQGLLLMEKKNRPAAFNRWKDLWKIWDEWLKSQSVSALQVCLGYALLQPEISRVLVGVDSLEQIQEIFTNMKTPFEQPPEMLMSDDLDLINPSRWSSH